MNRSPTVAVLTLRMVNQRDVISPYSTGRLTWASLTNDRRIHGSISIAGRLHELPNLISTAELHCQSITRDLGNSLTHVFRALGCVIRTATLLSVPDRLHAATLLVMLLAVTRWDCYIDAQFATPSVRRRHIHLVAVRLPFLADRPARSLGASSSRPLSRRPSSSRRWPQSRSHIDLLVELLPLRRWTTNCHLRLRSFNTTTHS